MPRKYRPTARMRDRRRLVALTSLLLLAALAFAATVVIRTAAFPFEKATTTQPPQILRPSQTALAHLSAGLQIPTVSLGPEENFVKFRQHLQRSYPLTHRYLLVRRIDEHGLLFHWRGTRRTRNPLLLCAHYDVVPVQDYVPNSLLKGWSWPPFSGTVAGGRVYGRGALDMKGMLHTQLEAVEELLRQNFQPESDVYLAFGFDEEIGGEKGAKQIARWLHRQGIRFEAVLDEGGIVAAAGSAGISRPVALVGVAEKGVATFRITVRGKGGHSSMPPRRSSLALAAELISALEHHPLPARLIPPVARFLERIGGSLPWLQRAAIANRWLMERKLLSALESDPATNALVRTTTAVTMARGADAENVLPSAAEVTVNFRILPTNSVEQVRAHVQSLCAPFDASIELLSATEPSRTSPADGPVYQAIRQAVNTLYPDAPVTPYLTLARTDARHYESLSERVYRFMPALLTEADRATIHGENESITVENYARMIAFFTQILVTR